VLVFGHGFVMTWSAYDVVWEALVSKGYIVVFPTTESSFTPSHTNFAQDIAYLVNAMYAENTNSSSTFYNSVLEKSAVMGHSMGGGSSFLAIQYNSAIDVLVSFAPAVTNPSSTTAASSITIPSLTFSGVNDCVAPPIDHQIPMHEALNSSCKTLINITGGSHCQFASSNFNCTFGELTCTPTPTISASEQQNITFALLLPWLNYYLKDVCQDANEFQALVDASVGISSSQNCELACTSAGFEEFEDIQELLFYPNPLNNSTHLNFNKNLKNSSVKILDIYGKSQKLMEFNGNSVDINEMNLSKGIYFIEINGILLNNKLILF
jgi:dienelactone hydrolase